MPSNTAGEGAGSLVLGDLVGAQKGETAIKGPPADGTPGFGWVYDPSDGTIVANAGNGEKGAQGAPFNVF